MLSPNYSGEKERGQEEWQLMWFRQRRVACFVFTKLLIEPSEIVFWGKGIRRLKVEQLPNISKGNKTWIDFEGLHSCPLY